MAYERILFETTPKKKTIRQRPQDGPPIFEFDEHEIFSATRRPMSRNHKEVSNHSKKFSGLVNKASNVLFRAKGVFPFEFFPDKIIIDSHKVNIIHKMFFFSDEIQSILIHNIKDVIADTSLLFGSLRILPDGYNESWVDIKYLWKKDAIRARRIILGLLVGHKAGIDISKVDTINLQSKIEALGSVN